MFTTATTTVQTRRDRPLRHVVKVLAIGKREQPNGQPYYEARLSTGHDITSLDLHGLVCYLDSCGYLRLGADLFI